MSEPRSLYAFSMIGASGKKYKRRAATHRAAWALAPERIVSSSARSRSGRIVPKG